MTKYTFLTSIYRNTKLNELKECVLSMQSQTVKPNQIVIVVDGPVDNDIIEYLEDARTGNPTLFSIVRIKENGGLGKALAKGMDYCRNEIVARIDTDDINVNDRIEKELKLMSEAKADIVGSNIAEFIGDISNVVSHRNVPTSHKEICEYLKSRCPFNHMTVLFKKSKVLEAGNYQDWYFDEDSYLWARMYLVNSVFANLNENLVYARIDENTFKRRGGYKYFKSEKELFKFMRNKKIISSFEYIKAIFIRFVVQVLMTNSMRQWFFKKFARD